MPTEIATIAKHSKPGLAENLPAQRPGKVSVAERTVAGQKLPPKPQQTPDRTSNSNESKSDSLQIEQAVDDLNMRVQNLKRDLHFSVDVDSGKTIIRVIDSETKETIRTIPSEDISAIAQKLEQNSGVLFSTSV